MKKKSKIVIMIVCIVLAVSVGWYIGMEREKKERAAEHRYSLDQVETANLSLTENGFVIGKDPQIILRDINFYVKEIFLEGLEASERIQIFYCNTGEEFSEEASIWVDSVQEKNGSLIPVERNVAALRVDFDGAVGSNYTLSAIILNPAKTAAWGIREIVVSLLFGGLFGLCIIVFLTERKNFRIYLGALKKYRYLLEDMVVRDIKLKYRRSVIGFFWSILNPLLMMCVITAVFQNLFRMNVDNFAVYYLTGWCVFNFVTEATSGAMTSILNSGALIRKVYIPKYIFPMQKCVFSFVNMLFSLVALLAVMLILRVGFTWRLLLVPIPLLLALVFSIGLGMVLATAAVFFRDVIHLYTVFTMVWMYLTPIIYPMDILSGKVLAVVKANPMYY